MKNDSLYFLLPLFKDLASFGNRAILAHAGSSASNLTDAIKNLKKEKTSSSGEFDFEGSHIKYRFHGSGCEIFVDGICVDFDYDFKNEGKIKFSAFKFQKFITSYTEFLTTNYCDEASTVKILQHQTTIPLTTQVFAL